MPRPGFRLAPSVVKNAFQHHIHHLTCLEKPTTRRSILSDRCPSVQMSCQDVDCGCMTRPIYAAPFASKNLPSSPAFGISNRISVHRDTASAGLIICTTHELQPDALIDVSCRCHDYCRLATPAPPSRSQHAGEERRPSLGSCMKLCLVLQRIDSHVFHQHKTVARKYLSLAVRFDWSSSRRSFLGVKVIR
jgi:hypothetical protein